MCNCISGITTAKRTYWYEGVDSHTEIIQRARLKDDQVPPSFVKWEFVPDWCDPTNLDKWTLTIDQDTVPDWFDRSDCVREARKIAQQVIASGRWVVGGSLDLSGTQITSLPDNLTVGGSLDLRGCAPQLIAQAIRRFGKAGVIE